MITLVIAVLALIFVVGFFTQKYQLENLFAASLLGLLIGFILAIWYDAVGIKGIEIQRINKVNTIMSLKGDNTILGKFYLGSGYIHSKEYYFMYSQRADGRIERVQVPVSSSYLIQLTNTQPHISWQEVTYRPPYWLHIWPKVTRTAETKKDIIVPPNTVVEKFTAF